jgi:hypothetical protein
MLPIIQDILYFHLLITFVYDLVTSALRKALPSVNFGRLLLRVKKLGIERFIKKLQCTC